MSEKEKTRVDVVEMRRAVRELTPVLMAFMAAGPAMMAAALVLTNLSGKLAACLDEIEELRRRQCS